MALAFFHIRSLLLKQHWHLWIVLMLRLCLFSGHWPLLAVESQSSTHRWNTGNKSKRRKRGFALNSKCLTGKELVHRPDLPLEGLILKWRGLSL